MLAIAATTITSALYAASVGDTVVWRNSGTAGSQVSQAYGNHEQNFCLPAIDGVPKGSSVRITNISLGSRNTECKIGGDTNADTEYLRITLSNKRYYDARLNNSGTFDGKTISAYGTYVPRLSYSYDGVTVTVGETNKLEFIYADSNGTFWYINNPGFKVVKTDDPLSAVTIGNTSGWYPVYEITATVVSLGTTCDTSATISGDASLSQLAWTTATTTDGSQWATINVTDDATLTLDAATNFKLLTLNVTHGKTLTLSGANALTATKIDISGKGKVKAATSALSGAVTGCGSLSYSGSLPSGVTFAYDWCGALTLENIAITGPNFNSYGNTASSVTLSGVTGWVNTGVVYEPELILDDGNYGFSLKINNGNSPQSASYNSDNINRCSTFRKVSGTGSIVDAIAENGKEAWPVIAIYDADDFAGNISLDLASILVRDVSTSYSESLYEMLSAKRGSLRLDGTMLPSLASGKKWSFKYYTEATDYNGLVLFNSADSNLLAGGTFEIKMNGDTVLNTERYSVKYSNGKALIKEIFGFLLHLH